MEKVECKRKINLLIFYCLLILIITSTNIGITTTYAASIKNTISSSTTSVIKPSVNLKDGRYLGTQTVNITSKTKGAIIYYTLDGTKPTTKSTRYTKPIKIKKSCIIKAVAIKNNISSKELVRYYQIYDYDDIFSDVERYTLAIKDGKVRKLSQFDQKVCVRITEVINEKITKDMPDFEKIKVIHDFIINNTSYDYSNYLNDTIPEESYTIGGLLLNKTAVCQGYAETFQVFMNILNIENKLISGTANNGGHAWNLVKLDGDWYHIDTTWDDPVGDVQILRYNYFLVNDEQMSIDHAWNNKEYPKCNKMNYDLYKDSIIESVSDYEEKFKELYNKGLRQISILYPENTLPNFNFFNGSLSYYSPEKFGDYYIVTVVCE